MVTVEHTLQLWVLANNLQFHIYVRLLLESIKEQLKPATITNIRLLVSIPGPCIGIGKQALHDQREIA